MLPAITAALLAFLVLASGAAATTAATLPAADAATYYALLHRQTGEYLGAAMAACFAWAAFAKPELRKFAGALCLGVVAEGLLGALPLTTVSAMLHSCLAQLLAASSVALVVAASKGYSRPSGTVQDYGWPSLRSLSIWLPVMIALQVAMGAAFRNRVLGLMPHVIGAMLISIFILVVGSFVLQQCKDHAALSMAGRALMVTTFVQVFLGLAVFTVRSMPPDAGVILTAATAHVVTGAALLAASIVLGMQIRKNVTPKGA